VPSRQSNIGTPIANGIDRVSELMNDRDDRDVGLNLQPHSNRPAKQLIAQGNTTPICVSLALVGETPPWARAGQ